MSRKDFTIEDVVDVSVPPISMADSERDLSNGQDIDLTEFAEFAGDEAGTPGELGVVLDSLQAVSEDIDTFAQTGAAPGDLEIHAEAIQEVLQIIKAVADSEIESYDDPLYSGRSISSTNSGDDTEDDQSSVDTIPEENLMKVNIDRISGSGNIIAEPVDSDLNHIHVQNGVLGDTAIAYNPDGKFSSKNGKNKPYTLPHNSVSDAQNNHRKDENIDLCEDMLVQIFNVEKEDMIVTTDRFDVDSIKLNEDVYIADDAIVLIKLTDINNNIAKGYIENKSFQKNQSDTSDSSNFKTSKPTKENQSTSRRKNHKSGGIAKLSDNPARNKNDLLSGKKF